MAKSRTTFSRGLLLLLGAALPAAVVTAQATQGASAPQPSGASSGVSTGKAMATPQSQTPLIVPKDLSELRIEPGDLLSVNVYDTPEFTNSYRVDLAGNLTIPLCWRLRSRTVRYWSSHK
jgi:protein involved in polysaccharide export with SLBB domain